jgi:hypothetical protein
VETLQAFGALFQIPQYYRNFLYYKTKMLCNYVINIKFYFPKYIQGVSMKLGKHFFHFFYLLTEFCTTASSWCVRFESPVLQFLCCKLIVSSGSSGHVIWVIDLTSVRLKVGIDKTLGKNVNVRIM